VNRLEVLRFAKFSIYYRDPKHVLGVSR